MRPSPARAAPHDATSWLPLPSIETLPSIEDLLTGQDRPGSWDVRPSPARAAAPDATAWLPLPSPDSLPSIDDLLPRAPGGVGSGEHRRGLGRGGAAWDAGGVGGGETPRDRWQARPSPARAAPHDATAWFPIPAVRNLPAELVGEVAGASDLAHGGAPEPRPGALALPLRPGMPWLLAFVMALVVTTAIGGWYALASLLDGGADVEVRVDGRHLSTETGVSTVGAVLAEQKVTLGAHDRVVPGIRTHIRNGMTINVLRAFSIQQDFDGVVSTAWSTYVLPADYLKREARLGDRVVVRSGPERLRENSLLVLRTLHTGQLTVDGQTVAFDSPSLNVGELLEKYSIELLGEDHVVDGTGQAVTLDSRLVDGTAYTVVRVGRELVPADEPYTLPDEQRPDADLVVGQTRDEPGAPGVMRVTYEITRSNGVETGRRVVSKVPIQVAKPTIHYYGTRADPMWDRIAQCETGGNWGMQGPLFSGGLGFYNQTWDEFGGRQYAPNAGLATREEQILVAENIRAKVGLSGWGCARQLGYVR